jgi:hypothetical protein
VTRRDADKLQALLKSKEKEKEEAIHIEETQRLVTERQRCSRLYFIWQQAGEGRIKSAYAKSLCCPFN